MTLYVSRIPVLCVQTVLFGLAVGRYLYLQWKGPMLIGTLYYTFLRDGIWSFFALFGKLVSNVIHDASLIQIDGIISYLPAVYNRRWTALYIGFSYFPVRTMLML